MIFKKKISEEYKEHKGIRLDTSSLVIVHPNSISEVQLWFPDLNSLNFFSENQFD